MAPRHDDDGGSAPEPTHKPTKEPTKDDDDKKKDDSTDDTEADDEFEYTHAPSPASDDYLDITHAPTPTSYTPPPTPTQGKIFILNYFLYLLINYFISCTSSKQSSTNFTSTNFTSTNFTSSNSNYVSNNVSNCYSKTNKKTYRISN